MMEQTSDIIYTEILLFSVWIPLCLYLCWESASGLLFAQYILESIGRILVFESVSGITRTCTDTSLGPVEDLIRFS